MSRFLQELSENKITIEEGLQRLLVIANKTKNKELAKWCTDELNGYNNFDDLPDYRRTVNRNIVYSGINGRMQVTNTPIGPGYLKEETIEKVSKIGMFENIAQIEKNKDSKEMIYRDLTPLASEIYSNTNDGYFGVQCTSVKQMIPMSVYSGIYSNVKTRIINLLCSYESAKINIDKLDISNSAKESIIIHNKDVYDKIVVEGGMYSFEKASSKIIWQLLIPTLSALISGVLVYLITCVWMPK